MHQRERQIEHERRVQPNDLRELEQRRATGVQQNDCGARAFVGDAIDDIGGVTGRVRRLTKQGVEKHNQAVLRCRANGLQARRAHRIVAVFSWMELDAGKTVAGDSSHLLENRVVVRTP